MSISPPTRLFRWMAALGALAGLAFSLSLVDARPAATAGDPPAGTAAMRVAIDPETGELVSAPVDPAKALSPEMANMLSRSTEGLVEVHHPDGRVSVDLQGRFMSASMARLDSNGELATTCVEDAELGADFLEGAQASDHDHDHDHEWEVR